MLTGILVLLLAVAALLAIPVTVGFRLAWPQPGDNDIAVRWAFGLVRAHIPLDRPTRPGAEGERVEGAPRQRSTTKSPNVLAAVRQRRFRRRIMRFARDCWRAIHRHDLEVSARIGLGDPADTGQLWAFLGPAAGLLANARTVSIRLEPDFVDATFELTASGGIRVVPLRFVHLAAALLLSPAVWSGIRQMRVS